MKYKKGDKVRVKSLEWFNTNKDKNGEVLCFTSDMTPYCGKIVTISKVLPYYYFIEESDNYAWTDSMLEGLAEPDVRITIAIPTDTILKKDSIKVGYNEESNEVILTADKEITYEPKNGDYVIITKNNQEYKVIISMITNIYFIEGIQIGEDSYNYTTNIFNILSLDSIRLATPDEKRDMNAVLYCHNRVWNPNSFKIEHKRWRAKKSELYYYITDVGKIHKTTEGNYCWNNDHYQFGNYFRTEQQAIDKAQQLKNLFQSIK